MKPIILFYLLITLLGMGQLHAQKVTVTIEGIRNNSGAIALGIYKNQQQFAQDNAEIKKSFIKKNIVAGILKIELQLPPGNYAIALLDDENHDNKMNYNFFGMPTEGFGFSNYVSTGLVKPKYSDFDFEVKEGETKVQVKMRYLL